MPTPSWSRFKRSPAYEQLLAYTAGRKDARRVWEREKKRLGVTDEEVALGVLR